MLTAGENHITFFDLDSEVPYHHVLLTKAVTKVHQVQEEGTQSSLLAG